MEEKRYVASLQDTIDPQCFKDFFESDKLEETKQKANEASEKHKRDALVFDRKFGTVYKKTIEKAEEVKPVIPKRGRKQKEEAAPLPPKKIIRKSAFFE